MRKLFLTTLLLTHIQISFAQIDAHKKVAGASAKASSDAYLSRAYSQHEIERLEYIVNFFDSYVREHTNENELQAAYTAFNKQVNQNQYLILEVKEDSLQRVFTSLGLPV
ncbi:MAG: hypothetical protein ACLFT3_01890 [Cyclobacteriaceae bacterium]